MLKYSKELLRKIRDENVLTPLYDNEDSVCGIDLGGFAYYFQKNLQGDVIAITNSYGNVVARYTYDAWGVCTIVSDETGIIARVNPYRYRSYYYDSEIGLYYLQSRYYDPTVSIFVNSDDIVFHFSVTAFGFYTAWHYCYNDPVNSLDEIGYASSSIKDDIKTYAKETWIAWLMNKFIKKLNNGRIDLINFNRFGLTMKLYFLCTVKNKAASKPVKPTTSSIEANFKGVSFKLGWNGKLDVVLGFSILKYSISLLRGVDWKRSYLALYISYVTNDGRVEFSTGLYISVAHLLKLVIAVTVAGACVVLPSLIPVFMSAISALSAKSGALVAACMVLFIGLQRVAS